MHKILLLLAMTCFFSGNAQKKLIPVKQSALSGISLPEGSRQDKRLLAEISGKALLEMETKKAGFELGKIELLELPPTPDAVASADSLKKVFIAAGWTLSPVAADTRYHWAERNGSRLIVFLDPQPKGTSLYMGQSGGSQAIINSNPAEPTAPAEQPIQQPASPGETQTVQQPIPGNNGISTSTTNFDDGWTASPQADWVLVTRNSTRVFLHYAIPLPDDLRSSDEASILTYFWELLPGPRYTFTQIDKKISPSYEYYRKYYAEGTGSINGQTVFVGFRILIDNGIARCIEIAAPDQQTYRTDFPDMDKIAAMTYYNRFAISATDITGVWKESTGGFGQFYNMYTGAYAGMNAVSIASEFRVNPDGNCSMVHKGAGGMVGSQQFFEEKHEGPYTIGNWEFSFTDRQGKQFPFHAFYQAVKNGRILYLQHKQYKGQEYYFIKAE